MNSSRDENRRSFINHPSQDPSPLFPHTRPPMIIDPRMIGFRPRPQPPAFVLMNPNNYYIDPKDGDLRMEPQTVQWSDDPNIRFQQEQLSQSTDIHVRLQQEQLRSMLYAETKRQQKNKCVEAMDVDEESESISKEEEPEESKQFSILNMFSKAAKYVEEKLCDKDGDLKCALKGCKGEWSKELFKHHTDFKKHMIIFHGVDAPYKCPQCDRAYQHANSVKQHITRVHDKKVNYACDLCNQTFYFRSNWKKHMINHHHLKTSALKKYGLDE